MAPQFASQRPVGRLRFDILGSATRAVLNCTTLDNWQDLMFAMGTNLRLHLMNFMSLVFVGVFFMLNITITILKASTWGRARCSAAARYC